MMTPLAMGGNRHLNSPFVSGFRQFTFDYSHSWPTMAQCKGQEPTEAAPTMPHDTPRLLIVDDSPFDLRVLGTLLRDMAQVSVASSGAEALSLAADRMFDVIILDVMLGDWDGFELCRRIRAMPQHAMTPIIFVTGLSDHDSEERGLRLGALDFITKPFAPALVQARIGNYIALSRSQRALWEANSELSRLAVVDSLTGLTNRRYLDSAADTELRRADRQDQPITMMVLDLDHFKTINDTHGHGVGDAVLVAMGQAWRGTLRSEDVLSRVGGEEFVALLPDTDTAQAEVLADRLLAVTRRLSVPVDNIDLGVTVSIGIAVRAPRSGMDYGRFLATADAALYEAKRLGRDRAVLADPDKGPWASRHAVAVSGQ